MTENSDRFEAIYVRIPAEPFRTILKSSMGEHDCTSLAESAGVDTSLLTKFMNGQTDSIAFRFADQLLCALNAVGLWHSEELYDIYMGVDFLEGKFHCGHPRTFVNTSPRGFCRTCANARSVEYNLKRKQARLVEAA